MPTPDLASPNLASPPALRIARPARSGNTERSGLAFPLRRVVLYLALASLLLSGPFAGQG